MWIILENFYLNAYQEFFFYKKPLDLLYYHHQAVISKMKMKTTNYWKIEIKSQTQSQFLPSFLLNFQKLWILTFHHKPFFAFVFLFLNFSYSSHSTFMYILHEPLWKNKLNFSPFIYLFFSLFLEFLHPFRKRGHETAFFKLI